MLGLLTLTAKLQLHVYHEYQNFWEERYNEMIGETPICNLNSGVGYQGINPSESKFIGLWSEVDENQH